MGKDGMSGDLRSNQRMNATHSAVTARAYCVTRGAVGRARYRERYALRKLKS